MENDTIHFSAAALDASIISDELQAQNNMGYVRNFCNDYSLQNHKTILFLLIIFIYSAPYLKANSNCLLLYNSKNILQSDNWFELVTRYYDGQFKKIDLYTSNITQDSLLNEQGEPYKCICINAATLEKISPRLIDSAEIFYLTQAVSINGSKLLICDATNNSNMNNFTYIKYLTNSNIYNIVKPPGANNWILSSTMPALTREFTNQIIPSIGGYPTYSIISTDSVQVIGSRIDSLGQPFPFFVGYSSGAGYVFLDAFQKLNDPKGKQMIDYFTALRFGYVSTMMFVRFSLGEYAWHNHRNFANLTIDDPHLGANLKSKYIQLISDMQAHGFHSTIGLIPAKTSLTDTSVVALFKNNAALLSLNIQGNNHDGWEFYCASQQQMDSLPIGSQGYPLRSLVDQEADIYEAVGRIDEFEEKYGLKVGRQFVYPYQIGLNSTLLQLKGYNYNAAFDPSKVPMLEKPDITTYDFNMRPFILSYNNFPLFKRYTTLKTNNHFFDNLFYWFIDMPIVYSREGIDFERNTLSFNTIADTVNNNVSAGEPIEWTSLDSLTKNSYLEKMNDDSSYSIMMFTPNVRVTNYSDVQRIFHVEKYETINCPMIECLVDSLIYPYWTRDSLVCLDLTIPAGLAREIIFSYSMGTKDYSSALLNTYFLPNRDSVVVKVDNFGAVSGPVSIIVSKKISEIFSKIDYRLINSVVAGGKDSAIFKANFISTDSLLITVDPYNISKDINNTNNTFVFRVNDLFCHLNLNALIEGYYDPAQSDMIAADTISLVLHKSYEPFTTVDSQRVVLDTLGSSAAIFPNAMKDSSYYVVVHTRNSIETWSAEPVRFDERTISFDFTDAQSKAFENNLSLKVDKYCLFSGDVFRDGFIDYTDLCYIQNDAYHYVTGYTLTDLNGDQFVDFSDLVLCENNSYNYVGVCKPGQKVNTRPENFKRRSIGINIK